MASTAVLALVALGLLGTADAGGASTGDVSVVHGLDIDGPDSQSDGGTK